MFDPAYIAIADDGHVTLFEGDGTEERRHVILRGPRVRDQRELIAVIEDLKTWAEADGYTVVVPAYDLGVPDIEIELSEHDAERPTRDDVDALLDDLFGASHNADEEDTMEGPSFDSDD